MAITYYKWTHPQFNPTDKNSFRIYLPFRLVKVEDGVIYHLIHADCSPNYWRESDELTEVDLINWEILDLTVPKTKEWVKSFSALEI